MAITANQSTDRNSRGSPIGGIESTVTGHRPASSDAISGPCTQALVPLHLRTQRRFDNPCDDTLK